MTRTRRIVLAERPKGQPTTENFRIEEADLPDPGEGELLVRTHWMSLDPYMRGRMDKGPSYAPSVEVGGTMVGQGVGEVLASNDEGFAPGDMVLGGTGWAEHAILPARECRKLDPDLAPVQTALGVLGMPGLTAWVGVNDILRVQSGQTVVISAATGAVGSVAGQIAKSRGARVIGVAGGAEKCAWAVDELGFDACLDHRDPKLADELGALCPQGIDCYFENVGGATLEAVLPRMQDHGAIAVCGMIAWYSGKGLAGAMPLPKAWRTILVKRLRVQGFIIFDHWDRLPEFLAEVAPMIADGRLRYRETVAEGLEAAPEAFLRLLEGGNFGKQLIRLV